MQLKCHLICLFIFLILKLGVALNEYQENISEDNPLKITEIFGTVVGSGSGKVDGRVLRTSSQFQCKVLVPVEDEHIIMFGTKAWIFPEQNVNLTIKYPRNDFQDCDDCVTTEKYIITKMEVIIHDDGADATSAYILSGGLLEESITVSFICKSATVISYQFWLYGVQKDTIDMESFKASSWNC